MNKLEAEVRKDILKFLNENKIFHFRIEDQMLSNFPDLMIIYKGKAIALELKRDSKTKARDGQLKVLKDIQIYGGAIARVVSSVDEVKEIIEVIREEDYMEQLERELEEERLEFDDYY